jgi:hypothetical protein
MEQQAQQAQQVLMEPQA